MLSTAKIGLALIASTTRQHLSDWLSGNSAISKLVIELVAQFLTFKFKVVNQCNSLFIAWQNVSIVK